MSELYKRIMSLCESCGMSGYKLCKKAEIQPSVLTDLKMGRQNGLSAKNLEKIARVLKVPSAFFLGRPPFDCWELINENRKGFLYYADIDPLDLELMWGIDPQNPDAAEAKDFITFLSDAVEIACPTEEGDWEITLRPAYRRKKGKAPVLTEKDERDIAKDLERIMAQLDEEGDLMFDGDPMSEEARESIRAAMKLGLEAAKVKNKERFTPKKYRKEQE